MVVVPHFAAIPGLPAANTTWIALGTVAIGCSFVLTLVSIVLRAREQKRRLELIEAALRNPSLTPEAARELAQALKPRPRRTLFVAGWFGAFGGILWLCTGPYGEQLRWAW